MIAAIKARAGRRAQVVPLEVLTAQQQAAEEEERVLIALKKKSDGVAKKKRDAAHLAGDLVAAGGPPWPCSLAQL